ncbi:hypothetical protein glysoja_032323 [Glycine soja]|uniref:Uncharacterized protein n=1 Tax=Glycine soja TaxID=3848 RepID=A0A0B2PK92_GLYSO|nr:hypothetical protein glysoja_032323 [Glycine soja]
MPLKPSYSSENLMLPVSDPPNDEDREWLLKADNYKTFQTRRIYAAISYMSCAGSSSTPFFASFKLILEYCHLLHVMCSALSSFHFPSAGVITLLQSATAPYLPPVLLFQCS